MQAPDLMASRAACTAVRPPPTIKSCASEACVFIAVVYAVLDNSAWSPDAADAAGGGAAADAADGADANGAGADVTETDGIMGLNAVISIAVVFAAASAAAAAAAAAAAVAFDIDGVGAVGVVGVVNVAVGAVVAGALMQLELPLKEFQNSLALCPIPKSSDVWRILRRAVSITVFTTPASACFFKASLNTDGMLGANIPPTAKTTMSQ